MKRKKIFGLILLFGLICSPFASGFASENVSENPTSNQEQTGDKKLNLNQDQIENLEKAIKNNSIQAKAAYILLDKYPNLVESFRPELIKLLEQSQALMVKARNILTKETGREYSNEDLLDIGKFKEDKDTSGEKASDDTFVEGKVTGVIDGEIENTSETKDNLSEVAKDSEVEEDSKLEDDKKVIESSETITVGGKTFVADTSRGVVKGNSKSMIYHVQGQRDYNKISVENVVHFASEDEAIKAGYRKAKR